MILRNSSVIGFARHSVIYDESKRKPTFRKARTAPVARSVSPPESKVSDSEGSMKIEPFTNNDRSTPTGLAPDDSREAAMVSPPPPPKKLKFA